MSQNLSGNLLVRLGICNKEDIVSNLLADLLKEPSFLNRWLTFVGLPPVAERKIDVRTRINAEGNIPDIAVLVGDTTNGSLLVIENKILATEGEAQTKRYSDEKTIGELGRAFEIKGLTRNRFHGLYLSLHDEGPKDGFQNIRYENIASWLRELAIQSPDPTRKLLASNLAELIEYFHSEEWASDDRLVDVLQCDTFKLGKNFVAFQRVFHEALADLPTSPGGVARTIHFWRGSGHGHSYYGGVIETNCAADGWFQALDFNKGKELWSTTHIEFQYAHQSRQLKLALHFETCPYKPRTQHTALFQGREHLIQQHDHARGKIMESLKTGLPGTWLSDSRPLQIAYANLEVKPETTIEEFQTRVRALVDSIIPVLDNAWKEVRA